MAGFPVLTTTQIIVGVDFHKAVPPPPPVGPLMTPHVVMWGSGLSQKMNFLWSVASTSKASSPESGCLKPVTVGGVVEEAAQASINARAIGGPVEVEPGMRAAALQRAMAFDSQGTARA